VKRRPAVAAALCFFGPGIGQLYAGHPWRALAIVVVSPMVAVATALIAISMPAPWGLVCAPLLSIAWLVAVAADAWRRVRVWPSERERPAFSQWPVCIVATMMLVPVSLGTLLVVRGTIAQTLKVSGGSMVPTLLIEERVLANRLAYDVREPVFGTPLMRRAEPQRGDVVVLRPPVTGALLFVKRVVGLPGETIEVRGAVVSIDGQELVEPYALFDASIKGGPANKTWGPERLPEDAYFVISDNRYNGHDSRHWGAVSRDAILGRIQSVYFSPGPNGGVRWERLGQEIR
jgi:signal peptidase I